MHTTAAVINAGLGDISLALEMAGFKVVSAYEPDIKALAVHETNIAAPVYPLSVEDIDVKTFPKVDLLAARAYFPSFSRAMRTAHSYCDSFMHKLFEILSLHRPRALFLLLNVSSVRGEHFRMCMDEFTKAGYQLAWQTIDVAQTTGVPVSERMFCMVGTLQSTGKYFEFSALSNPGKLRPELYLQLDQRVDTWYFRVSPDNILPYDDKRRFYCWKNSAYVGTDLVQWNFMKVPLVNIGRRFRKITHREIANLKGFPERYSLFDDKNKQWLYQKLMYTGNVLVIKQIADMINEERKGQGKPREGVLLPVPPLRTEMDTAYFELRDSVIMRIKETRLRFVIQANTEMITLYWHIGNDILRRQETEGWGARVIDRLSEDLKEAFPEMDGFSARNLKYMRKFAETWTDSSIVQQPVAQLQWRSIIMLLTKLKTNEEREWYAQRALEQGWSSNVLWHMIDVRYMERKGKSVTNFEGTLPPSDSDMAIQTFNDPYLFDFIGTAEARREAEVERALLQHMEKFLLELGQGFAFVGRQVHLEVGGDDFYIDLLFYHLKLRCYVVIELKARDFEPGDVAQLSFYQNIVNDVLRHPDDKQTIGLLLVKGKNRTVVEYSLEGYTNPISVADWQEQLQASLPDDIRSSLPTIEEIEREIEYAQTHMELSEVTEDIASTDSSQIE